jgi:antitoxin (DNA-binding transcriptional repressor) of toxin-antitoxin stability system
MIKVNVHEAKSRLSELLRAVTDEGAVEFTKQAFPGTAAALSADPA